MDKKHKIFWTSIIVILIFGILDAKQIIPWQTSQNWTEYEMHVGPTIFFMWILALAAMAFIYYIIVKDKSEAVGIFAASWIMLSGGLEDLSFFLFSNNTMPLQMCWFNGPQDIVSRLLGEACVTPLSLILNALVSVYLAWVVLKWFWRQDSW